MDPFWQFVLPATNMILNPRSEVYFRPTREAMFFGGVKLEDVVPKGEKRQVEWMKGKATFEKLHGLLEEGRVDGPYVMGTTPCFTDFAIAAAFLWIKYLVGEESEEWKDILTWQNGRWAALLESLNRYASMTS
jgi:glutathione S-transferase